MSNEIGWAIEAMRAGGRVRRAGWNGRGMWIAINSSNLGVVSAPFVYMRAADGSFVPWLCSATDLLADDWESSP